jgi:hypothetical protein
MRAITGITIRVGNEEVTMFLFYNDNPNDYSFNNYPSVKSAFESLKKDDPYFPIMTNTYRFLKIKGNKTLVDRQVEF